MTALAILILAALLAVFVLETLARTLNARSASGDLPPAGRSIYEEDAYERSQRYTQARMRLATVSAAVNLIALVLFWLLGGFGALDASLRTLGWGPVPTGLLFFGVLGVASALLNLPIDAYDTFVLEERFDFNTTTPRTFVLDRIKGAALSIVIGAPIGAAVIAFFAYTGSWAWVYAWITVTVVTVALQFLAPRYIMPLFNEFEPVGDEDVRSAIAEYAERVGFPYEGLYVMDGSRRTTKSNAFFTGFGAHKRIVLFDTLLEAHPVDEIVSVVAHEVGHFEHDHLLQRIGIQIAHLGVLFLLLSVVLQSEALYAAFFIEEASVYAGLVLFGLLYSPVETLLAIPLNALSRRHEYQADAYAGRTTGSPETLAEGLGRLAEENLANLTPHRLYVMLNYSHPPLLDRIAALRPVPSSNP